MIGDIGSVVLYTLLGAILGIILILLAAFIVPRIIAMMTPRINEEKELVRGNQAVAEYYGRIVAAVIIAIGLIIAAAIVAGIHGW